MPCAYDFSQLRLGQADADTIVDADTAGADARQLSFTHFALVQGSQGGVPFVE